MAEHECDVLIIGGSLGGCAAAMSATSLGLRVILAEELPWIGGQLTSQAVPPDEHPWIESRGCTQRYRRFRELVREEYRRDPALSEAARRDPLLNPGDGWVSRLCHEPKIALKVLESMLGFALDDRCLDVWTAARILGASVSSDRITDVQIQRESGEECIVRAQYVLDATEEGAFLPRCGAEYVVGAESKQATGEPHAVDGPPEPDNVQGLTWCFAMSFDPDGDHVIERPATYDRWRSLVPAAGQGLPLLGWRTVHPKTGAVRRFGLFPWEDEFGFGLFAYRRIVASRLFTDGRPDVTIVNWPQNDYFEGSILDVQDEVRSRRLQESRELSLSLLYWLQTEAGRLDGGIGYPGLYLRPDVVGTSDGLAMAPYIRESRRIVARETLSELHVGAAANSSLLQMDAITNSVGIGAYRIDLHPSTNGRPLIDIDALPFQIPLGTLIPVRLRNLMPACKNFGVTHIANGCTRLHPVEWNVGEAAGLLAGFCVERKIEPADVHASAQLTREFQALLSAQGFELTWADVHPL